ncbi:MAG: BatA and WFA domain-containing protein [Planctomycetaceae bacterium]|nr:BatA and WFA domain-containing protein [Planctomycetaceae bacterium]
MSIWILQHFLNPAYFWPGVALIAAPIIIHLIHRLRYRTVRFAAMEFLLASEQRNRRRVMFEQLLLLLLRILLILLLVALIGRMVLDPEELSLFQGAKAHHVVILDDTASMQDRLADGTAFDAAKTVLQKVVAEGARRPGTQKLSVILMSRPEESMSGLSERDIDPTLLTELADRLPLIECTHQSHDPAQAIVAALDRLGEDRGAVRQVHVVSDFRSRDWLDNKSATSALQDLAGADVGINLVRCVGDIHDNLSLTDLTGSVEIAAAGVPVTFHASIANRGTRETKDVRAQLLLDGQRLPRTLDFGTIPPGETLSRRFEVVFDTPKLHRLQVQLGEDAFIPDDARYLAVNVPVENPVLIIDGSPAAEQALYLADALAADKSVTGLAPAIHPPDDLRKLPLDRFHLIYLVNVPEFAPDAIDALQKYVRGGGGLVWFLGPAVNAVSYNATLFGDTGLFPIQLAKAPSQLQRPGGGHQPDIVIGNNPVFAVFQGEENPFIDAVFVNRTFPPDREVAEGDRMLPEVDVLATLSDSRPLILEHRLGAGRIVTCLTSAGPVETDGEVWTNWANGPGRVSFVVVQLELARHVARRDRALPSQTVGEPIVERLNRAFYREDVEITAPDDQVTRLKAASDESTEDASPDEEAVTETVPMLVTRYRETDLPGIYAVTRYTQDQTAEQTLIAFNVPAEEGELELANEENLRRQLGNIEVEIQAPGEFNWIRSDSPGSEIRWLLIVALCLIGICEQLLAYRLSYH